MEVWKWISVEERLPEESEPVLVAGKEEFSDEIEVLAAYRSMNEFLYPSDDGEYAYSATATEVTHWTPYPTLPEALKWKKHQ